MACALQRPDRSPTRCAPAWTAWPQAVAVVLAAVVVTVVVAVTALAAAVVVTAVAAVTAPVVATALAVVVAAVTAASHPHLLQGRSHPSGAHQRPFCLGAAFPPITAAIPATRAFEHTDAALLIAIPRHLICA